MKKINISPGELVAVSIPIESIKTGALILSILTAVVLIELIFYVPKFGTKVKADTSAAQSLKFASEAQAAIASGVNVSAQHVEDLKSQVAQLRGDLYQLRLDYEFVNKRHRKR